MPPAPWRGFFPSIMAGTEGLQVRPSAEADSMAEKEEIRQFGTPQAGVAYMDRPGVYAVALVRGRVLVVETPMGWFLPGGGVRAGETPERALRREVGEETGYGITALTRLGSARQVVGRRINKVETFYRVKLERAGATWAEPDYRPRWVDLEDAVHGLREEAQAWALETVRDPGRSKDPRTAGSNRP